jgi:hypothetical protein
MNVKAVLSAPVSSGDPKWIADCLTDRYFNGRNGTETVISRDELKQLLEGAAKIAQGARK